MSRFSTIVIFGAVCLLIARAANGQESPLPPAPYYFFSTSATYNGPTTPNVFDGTPTAIVGFDKYDAINSEFLDPAAVNLTFGTGGSWENDMWVYNGSTLNVNGGNPSDPVNSPGGTINGIVYLEDNSTGNLNDQGFVFALEADDNSTFNMTGGAIGRYNDDTGQYEGGLSFTGSSTGSISGGKIGTVSANGGSTVTISNGSFGDIYASDMNTSVVVSGGSVVDQVISTGGAMITLSGGTFQTTLVAAANGGQLVLSGVTIPGVVQCVNQEVNPTSNTLLTLGSGNTVSSLGVADYSETGAATINMSGGNVTGSVSASDTGVAYLAGGSIGGSVTAATNSSVFIQGNVAIDGSVTETGAKMFVDSNPTIAGSMTASGGQITMTGGTISGGLYAQGSSVIALGGGNVLGALQITGTSLVTMTDGTIATASSTANSSTLLMSGGSINGLSSKDSSVINISGGTDGGSLGTYNSSAVFISGSAKIQGGLNTYNSSNVTINGGSIYGGVNAYNSSTVTWNGGAILFGTNAVSVHDGAKFIWQGGTITSSNAIGIPAAGSTVRPLTSAGGNQAPIYVYDNGTFEIDGINLSASLVDPNNGDGMFSEYQLSGLFGDGTSIPAGAQFFVQNTTGGVAPPTFSLVGVDQKWKPAVGGTWASTANWAPAILADGAGDFADFSGVTAPATITLDGNRTVGQLGINNSSNAVTIAQGSGGSLILNNNGADVHINIAGNEQITAPVVGQDNTDVVTVANSSLAFMGGITMAAGKTLNVTFTGFGIPGALSVPTGSVINGNVAANPGTIDLEGGQINGNVSTIAGFPVKLASGTVNGNVSARNTANVVLSGATIQGDLQLAYSSTGTMNGGSISGGVTATDSSTLQVNGGTIAGGVSVQYDAAMTLSGGTIDSLLGQNSGKITMNGGTVGGSVELDDSSSMTLSGGTISLGLSAVTVNDSAKFTWSGGTISSSAANNQIPIYLNDSSSLKISGFGLNSSLVDPNNDGGMYSEYQLTGYLSNGTAITSGTQLFVQNPAEGSSAPSVVLTDLPQTWATAGGGSWGGAANWSPAIVASGPATIANLAAASSTITLDGDRSVGTLLMQGSNSFDIAQGSGGSLYLNNNGSDVAINVAGDHQILAPVVAQDNADITIAAGGSLSLADGITSTTGKTVTLTSSNAGSLTISGSGTISGDLVASGGSLDMEGDTVNGKLSASGSSTVTLGSGNIAGELLLQNTAYITMNGGAAGGVESHDSSELDMFGGEIDGDINAYDTSFVYLPGGAVYGNINAYNSSVVEIAGEYPPSTAGPDIKANALGANAHPLTAPGSTNSIYVHDSAELAFTGINLGATLLDGSNDGGMYSEYQLTGYYADGTTIPSGVDFFVQNNTGATYAFFGSGQQWNAGGGGSWGNAANWLPAIPADGAGQLAQFNSGAAPATISLDGNRTLGQLFMTGGEPFTITAGSGGTLTLDYLGYGAYVATSGHQQIAVPVIAQDNTDIDVSYDPSLGQSDNGSLTLSDGITVSAGKNLAKLDVGTLSVAFIRGGTLEIDGGTVSVIPNGTSAGASRLERLVIYTAGGAAMDLANNDLLVNNSTLADIVPLIQSGFASGKWNGAGIISSLATNVKGLGVLTGAQFLAMNPGAQFDGNTVDDNDVLIKYTAFGDTNFDGVVDASDYQAIDNGFNMGLGDWADGDFNYDGVVNGDDYTLIDNAFNSQGSVDPEVEGVPAEMIASDTEQLTAVPEPASVGMIFIGTAALLRRRRFN